MALREDVYYYNSLCLIIQVYTALRKWPEATCTDHVIEVRWHSVQSRSEETEESAFRRGEAEATIGIG